MKSVLFCLGLIAASASAGFMRVATTTVYTLESAPDCAQVDVPTAYLPEAQGFDKNLKVGKCSDLGYTLADGTTTKTVPVIGKLVVYKFKKAGMEVEGGSTTLYTLEKAPVCGEFSIPSKYVGAAMGMDKSLKKGSCSGVGYTVAAGTTTKTEPIIGKLTIHLYKKAGMEVEGGSTTLYTLEKAPECGEFDLSNKYVSIAMSTDKSLKKGSCSGAGYTVADGTTTKTEPVIGKLVIRKFKKAAVAAVGDIWSSCAKSGDKLSNLAVKITPDPPVKGQSVTIVASGTLSETVSSGKINLVIKVLGIPVVQKSLDLCTASPKVSCPIAAGPLDLTVSENIPSAIPSGSYTGEVKAVDQSGAEITCVDLKLKF